MAGDERRRQLDDQGLVADTGRAGEAALAEDVEHAAVVAQHVGVQRRDPLLACALGQVREQHRGQAASLHRVGDGKGDLGPVRVDAQVLRVTDDRVLGQRDQPERVVVVDVDRTTSLALEVDARAEEPKPARPVRQRRVERHQIALVLLPHRPDMHHRPVAQAHVDGVLRGERVDGHSLSLAEPAGR